MNPSHQGHPTATPGFAASSSMHDNHRILAHVQTGLPGTNRRRGPLVKKSHEWAQLSVSERCQADEEPNNGTSRTVPYTASTYQSPNLAAFMPASRPNSLNDIPSPAQNVHSSHGTDYVGHPPMRPENRPEPQAAYHYPHSLPVHPQYHMQIVPAQYSPDMLAYDRQALQAKQDAILAAAHEYASKASAFPVPVPDEGGSHSGVPPPSYYDVANTAFPAHPGPYYYHHLHHHRHYHHYPPPPDPGYYGQAPQPPALHRQDSSASSVSRNSETSGSTASHPSSTQLDTQKHLQDGNSQDVLAPYAALSNSKVFGACEQDTGSGSAVVPGDVDKEEDAEGGKAKELSVEDQHRRAPRQSLYAGSSRTADSIRNRRSARSSTKPYPSVPSGRSASSSSACSSAVATPAALASPRTLRSSSSSLAATVISESEDSAEPSSGREAKPRASKTVAVSKLTAVDTIYDPFDAPPTLEDNIKSLANRPTKKSRGRRAVLTEELNLDNAESQAPGGSESSYALVRDGRAMPVTKEQLEFAGTTKTGRPRMIFICQVPGCDKCFRRAEHLRRHLEGIHSNVKPHICDVSECRRAFARRDNLKQHMKAVHGRKDAKDQIFTPPALTAEDIEEANAAFAGC